MFMFRKKETTKSVSTGLQKQAKKFQETVKEINTTVKPGDITIDVINSYAEKSGVESEFMVEAFETYLRQNALTAIRKIKTTSNYTVLNLEQAAANYGFSTDDLNITFFSED